MALLIVIVSLPLTAVVSITISELRTRAFSKAVPPDVPEIISAGVVPSISVLFSMVTTSLAPGRISVKTPTESKSNGSRSKKSNVASPTWIVPSPNRSPGV